MDSTIQKTLIFICAIVVILVGFGFYSNYYVNITGKAAECTPDYVCGEWSDCAGDLRTRICVDKACGKKDITERKFCSGDCKPEYECSSWSSCIYTSKVESFFLGEIKFTGYQERVCSDTTGCADSFKEEQKCSQGYELDLERIEECGINYLVATDPGNGKPLAKIPLDDVSLRNLDIIFVQDVSLYCPHCYNARQDEDETGVDCGGSCKECMEESSVSMWNVLIVFLGVSVVVFLVLIAYAVRKFEVVRV